MSVNRRLSAPPAPPRIGVRLAGTGSALPQQVLSNKDLEKLMETSDEWIVQRTGIHERRIISRERGESTASLSAAALSMALKQASLAPSDLDLIVIATMSPEMGAPPTSCLVSKLLGVHGIGAFDVSAACTGFVAAMNIAHDMIRMGNYRNVGVVGADTLSQLIEYSTRGRSTAILFGDGAGAVILRATDDPTKGILAQSMHAEGDGWKDIYIPHCPQDFPEGDEFDSAKLGKVQMNGQSVFRFAVSTFPQLIQETLDKAGLKADDVSQYICHQSNGRILEAARKKFDLSPEKLLVNIDRYGNTVAASVPLCLDELNRSGKINEGERIMFLAFGAGLTWASSLWQI